VSATSSVPLPGALKMAPSFFAGAGSGASWPGAGAAVAAKNDHDQEEYQVPNKHHFPPLMGFHRHDTIILQQNF